MATCEHEQVETDIQHTAVGRKWQQVGPISYCPTCRRWSKRIRLFMDGQFFKTDKAAGEAQRELNDRCRAERQAWLAEHYPDHVTAGAA